MNYNVFSSQLKRDEMSEKDDMEFDTESKLFKEQRNYKMENRPRVKFQMK